MGRPLHIIKLATANRPEEKPNYQAEQDQGQRYQQVNNFHYLDNLKAFNTTINELSDMPMAAIHGITNPIAAAGMAQKL